MLSAVRWVRHWVALANLYAISGAQGATLGSSCESLRYQWCAGCDTGYRKSGLAHSRANVTVVTRCPLILHLNATVVTPKTFLSSQLIHGSPIKRGFDNSNNVLHAISVQTSVSPYPHLSPLISPPTLYRAFYWYDVGGPRTGSRVSQVSTSICTHICSVIVCTM